MAFIESYPVFDFSGGVRRNVAPNSLRENELLDARNVDLSERGRVKVRRGSHQVGNTLTGTIENSFVFKPSPAGGTPTITFLVNNNASSAILYKLLSPGRLATALTTASTTVVLDSENGTVPLAASGTIEIEGDLIAYSAKDGDNVTLTGVTGVSSAHAVGTAVHQWEIVSQSGTPLDGQCGITYASLNNTLIIAGRIGNLKQMNSSGIVSDVTSEPAIIFLTNYRDRLYGAGDGGAGTNGSPIRVSFSARGDGTSWTTGTDYFDVYDQRGEYVTGIRVFNDTLGIFKTNSIFTYNEIELKQRVINAGAYNDKVVKEVNGSLFTFCPTGIYQTNLTDAKQIGEPVRQYWKNFRPQYDATGNFRVVTNTFAGVFENSYFLFIGDVTDPSTANSVVLEYNTITGNWVVHEGMANNFRHFQTFENFRFGDNALTSHHAFFAGDTAGKYWRLFENVYIDNDDVYHGGNLLVDRVSDSGTPVTGWIETRMYDLTHPNLFKKFGRMRCFSERGEWKVSYRVEDEKGLSEYRPLGTIGFDKRVLQFPSEARGWRIGFKIVGVSVVHQPIFQGFILEKTETDSRV